MRASHFTHYLLGYLSPHKNMVGQMVAPCPSPSNAKAQGSVLIEHESACIKYVFPCFFIKKLIANVIHFP